MSARSCKRGSTILQFKGAIFGVAANLTAILVFWGNWNLWLILAGILALIGLPGSPSSDLSTTDKTGIVLCAICFAMMAAYGLFYKLESRFAHEITHPTVLACGVDSERDEYGNVYEILRTPHDSFNVLHGTYYILQEGRLRKVFAPTAEKAVQLFQDGHAYQLTVDNHEGYSFLGVTSAKEVPNKLGTCSD